METKNKNDVNATESVGLTETRELNDAVTPVEPKEGVVVGELNVAEFNWLIENKKDTARIFGPSEYEFKDKAEAERQIARQQTFLAEKKADYERAIEMNKKYLKEEKKKLRAIEKTLAEHEEMKKRYLRIAETFRDIRDDKFPQEEEQ